MTTGSTTARQQNLPYVYDQVATRDNKSVWWSNYYDDYDLYMHYGSAGAMGKAYAMGQIGFWNKLTAHPAYDHFWSGQALDRILGKLPLQVPVMLVDSLWDQEDIYGAMAVYKAIEPKDSRGDMVYLVIGPWHHGQEIEAASQSGRAGDGFPHWQQPMGAPHGMATRLRQRV